MKNLHLLLISIFFYSFQASADCTNAYSSATYALAHTKKSLKADNFDHQKYYADRALEAFEKTQKLVSACGCEDAKLPIISAIDNLKNATDPADWEAGRFYVKKALEQADQVIASLDICTSSSVSVSYKTEQSIPLDSEITKGQESLLEKQRELEMEQQKLLEQQRQLEEKIARQKQLAEQNRLRRQLELEEQLKLKRVAENSLLEIRNSLKDLALSLQCDQALKVLETFRERPDGALNQENLEQTRAFYLKQTLELNQSFKQALEQCMVTPSK